MARHPSWQQPGDKESSQLHYDMTGDHVHDIRRYGAVSNPAFITENTVAIQLAIDTANARGGGMVFVPQGIYFHTGITMRSNVHLIGDGWKSILYLDDDSDRNSIDCVGITDFVIRDLMVNNNRDNQDDAVCSAGALHWDCITIEDTNGDGTGTPCERALVENVYTYKGSAHGIRVAGCIDVVVTNCRAEDNGDDGITCETGSSFVLIEGNYCYNNLSPSAVSTVGSGIELDEGISDVTVVNNLINDAVLGVHLGMHAAGASAQRVSIINNKINNVYRGIVIAGDLEAQGELVYDVIVQGNIIEDCDDVGMRFEVCDDVIIADNIIRNTLDDGIEILNLATNIYMNNNHITDATGNGINLLTDVHDITIANCSAISCGENGILGTTVYNIVASECICRENDKSGIVFYSSFDVEITGGIYQNNSIESVGGYSGVYLSTVDGFRIIGVLAYDDQGTQTQNYGIRVSNNCLNGIVAHNDVRNNRTAGLFDDGTTVDLILDGNLGDVTDTPATSFQGFSGGDNVTVAGATRYIMNTGEYQVNRVEVDIIIPFDCIISHLYARISAAPGAGESHILTLMDTAGATILTCTIDGAAEVDDEDLVNQVAVTAGEQICVRVVSSGAAAAATIKGGFKVSTNP